MDRYTNGYISIYIYTHTYYIFLVWILDADIQMDVNTGPSSFKV